MANGYEEFFMAADQKADKSSEPTTIEDATAATKKTAERRDIPGNLTYLSAPGALKRALEGITVAERPDKFSGDFVSTVLKVTGGSGRAVPPVLKRMGFLSADGTPTDLYSKFKSETNRSNAALEGLKRAFGEIFRRNDYAHRLDQNGLRDIVIEITGLKKSEPVVSSIVGTFQAVKDFIDESKLTAGDMTRERNDELSNVPLRRPLPDD